MRSFSLRCLSLFSLCMVYQQFCSAEPINSNPGNQSSAALCDCGGWTEDGFDFTTAWNGQVAQFLTESKNQSCGSTYIDVDSNAAITFNSGDFICYGNSACTSHTSWSVTGGNASPSSGTGYPAFTIDGTGTYVLMMHGSCGFGDCDSCMFTYITKPSACNCGQWMPITVNTGSASYVNQTSGSSYIIEKNIAVSINGLYDCFGDDSCNAGYTWSIKKNNVFHEAGSELPLTFTPSEAGVYLVEIDPSCQGHDCSSSQFTFQVKEMMQTGVELIGLSETDPVNIEMNVTPNPVRDLVTLRLTSEKHEAGMISWYNELGIVVQQIYVEWNGGEKLLEMNSQDLPAGIYFVGFNGENGRPIVKVSVYH